MNERYLKYKDTFAKYKKINIDKCNMITQLAANLRRFGIKKSTQDIILILGGKCVKCGMASIVHIEKYKRQMSVHHKDGNGRNSEIKNNAKNNLSVLCLPCHMKEHSVWDKRWIKGAK